MCVYVCVCTRVCVSVLGVIQRGMVAMEFERETKLYGLEIATWKVKGKTLELLESLSAF